MFRLRQDAEDWLKHIASTKPLKTKFDLNYLCLIVGLASGFKSEPQKNGKVAQEFVDYFVEDYKDAQYLIIGLLVVAELGKNGIDLDEKKSVRDQIRKLVNPESQTKLTSKGIDELNRYASGGFDFLRQQYGISKPYHTAEFLLFIATLTKQTLDESQIWNSMIGSE
ncbi:MAG: hypothetical protein OXI60_07755 [Acidiferrobacterales bacterium]|nr:hypothetical protein [Acidiferrobacterales bacterium]